MMNANNEKMPFDPLQRPVLKAMRRSNTPVFCAQHQSGAAMSEYLIGTVGVVIALFTPIPGLHESAFVFMVEVLKGFQANTTYLMSLP